MATNSTSDTLTQQRDRLRVRAVELRRQQQVLRNELESPGIGGEQATFLRNRIDTLSTEEEGVGAKMAQLERSITEKNQEETQARLGSQRVGMPARTAARNNPRTAALAQRLQISARQRILQIQRDFSRHRDEDGVAHLTKTRRPEFVGFLAVFCVALSIDILCMVLTYFTVKAGGLSILLDIAFSIYMFFVIRAFVNRSFMVTCLLAGFLMTGFIVQIVGVAVVFLTPITTPISAVLMLPVMIAGIWNPDAKAIKVGRGNIQQRIQGYEKKIQKVKKVAEKISKSGLISKDNMILKRIGRFELAGAFLNYIPWQSIAVVSTYRSLKKNYRESQMLLAEYQRSRDEALLAQMQSVEDGLLSQLTGIKGAVQPRPLALPTAKTALRTPAIPRGPPSIARPVLPKGLPAAIPAAA